MADVPATTAYQPPRVPLARKLDRFNVCRVFPDPSNPTNALVVQPLPNIRMQAIDRREAAPAMTQCRYAFTNSNLNPGNAPRRIQDVYNFASKGTYIVNADDLIWITKYLPNGQLKTVTYGYAQMSGATLNEAGEQSPFAVADVSFRCWDSVLPGAVYRDADGQSWNAATSSHNYPEVDPAIPQDIQTDLPLRFNPDGKFSATPLGSDSGTDRDCGSYAVFIDPTATSRNGSRQWTLPMAVRHVIAMGTKDNDPNLKLGSLAYLDSFLQAIAPSRPGGFIDLTKPSTYTKSDILVSDLDVSGDTWPNAVRRLLEPHGFSFSFRLNSPQPPELPQNTLQFFDKRDVNNRKLAYIQAPPAQYDPGRTNVLSLELVRDSMQIQNSFFVSSEMARVEASFVLLPLFIPADISNPLKFVKGNRAFAGDLKQYRLFGLDEAGQGHWTLPSYGLVKAGAWSTEIPDLKALLQPGATGADPRTFCHRSRKPRLRLLSKDPSGARLNAKLEVSVDYPPIAGLWNPAQKPIFPEGGYGGTWQEITKQGWKLNDSQTAIEITGDDPSSWSIGSPPFDYDAPFPNGVINVLQSIYAPTAISPGQTTAPNAQFVFRLTCVIETDHDLQIVSKRRSASPTRFTIRRSDDTRDRFKLHSIGPNSALNPLAGNTTAFTPVVDDTAAAQAHCDSRRRANELAPHAGTINLGCYSDAYQIGDKIKGIAGRNISFNMNNGSEQGESPINPVIVAISHHFEPNQETVLAFCDFRAEPAVEHRRDDHEDGV